MIQPDARGFERYRHDKLDEMPCKMQYPNTINIPHTYSPPCRLWMSFSIRCCVDAMTIWKCLYNTRYKKNNAENDEDISLLILEAPCLYARLAQCHFHFIFQRIFRWLYSREFACLENAISPFRHFAALIFAPLHIWFSFKALFLGRFYHIEITVNEWRISFDDRACAIITTAFSVCDARLTASSFPSMLRSRRRQGAAIGPLFKMHVPERRHAHASTEHYHFWRAISMQFLHSDRPNILFLKRSRFD